MMAQQDLHPIAHDVLNAYAATDFFRSHRFTKTLAERIPNACATWALNLVEARIREMDAHTVVTETLDAVRRATESPTDDIRPTIDDLSWRSWASGSFDDSSPYLQRAVARLGWAAIWLICHHTQTGFESRFTGRHFEENDDQLIAEMTNQCAMAIDMTYTETQEGRLMVADSFSREMASLG